MAIKMFAHHLEYSQSLIVSHESAKIRQNDEVSRKPNSHIYTIHFWFCHYLVVCAKNPCLVLRYINVDLSIQKDDNNLYDFSEDFAVIHTKLIISSKVLIKTRSRRFFANKEFSKHAFSKHIIEVCGFLVRTYYLPIKI